MNAHFSKPQILQGKLLPLLVGALSLALSTTVLPAALAQSGLPQDQGNRQARQGNRQGENWLELTPEQQTQLEQIRQEERSQIAQILTADQKARVQEARANGQNPREIFQSLDLTDEQRSQIRAIHESSRSQMEEILTPEQLQKLREHRGTRGNGNDGPSAPPEGE